VAKLAPQENVHCGAWDCRSCARQASGQHRHSALKCAVAVDESKVTEFVGVIDIGQITVSSAAAWPADSVSNSNDMSFTRPVSKPASPMSVGHLFVGRRGPLDASGHGGVVAG
jgi:hypothetical protein